MPGKILKYIRSTLAVIRNRRFREKIIQLVNSAVSADNPRNKVIICDFIIEKDTSPQDGFELFRYICAQKKRTLEPFYIINENSAAYKSIKSEYGSRIIPFSEERFVSFAYELAELLKTTRFICSGFQVMHALNLGITDAVKNSPYVYSVFTQHGINFFKNSFISSETYSAFLFDRIMVSNELEKKLFMERCRYSEKQLIKNGLFRWDLLSAENAPREKSIFIYFTHRRYLRELESVRDSVYFRTIAALLENSSFRSLIKEYGITLKLAMHHSVLPLFKDVFPDNVQLLEDAGIADAKRTSSLLITDYSSMCFEMWFQHKPVIFLNIPDSEDCLKYGHKTDLVSPYGDKENSIPNISDSPEECTVLLKKYLENNFAFTSEENKIRDSFFYYNSDFCRRFYEQLAAMSQQRKEPPVIAPHGSITLAETPYLHTWGLAPPDGNGRKITGEKAEIGFIAENASRTLVMSIRLLADEDCCASVRAYANGHFLRRYKLSEETEASLSLEIPQKYLSSDNYTKITLCIKYLRGDNLRILSLKRLT